MNIEYEATFPGVDPEVIRDILEESGGALTQKEFLQRRVVFLLPQGHEKSGSWLRVRDEGNKITLSYKRVHGDTIEDQKEICLTVSDFNEAAELLESIGCVKKAYQENRRERWTFEKCEVTIDTWPFLEPFVEVEGKNKHDVQIASQKLGFDFSQALFCSVDTLYSLKYKLPKSQINDHTPKIIFEMHNPFTNGRDE